MPQRPLADKHQSVNKWKGSLMKYYFSKKKIKWEIREHEKVLFFSKLEFWLLSSILFLPVLNLAFVWFFSCRGTGLLVMWFRGQLSRAAAVQLLFLGRRLSAGRELWGGGDCVECGHLGAFDHTVPATRGHQVGPRVQTCHRHGNCCDPYRGKYRYSVVKMVYFVSIFLPLLITKSQIMTFSIRV